MATEQAKEPTTDELKTMLKSESERADREAKRADDAEALVAEMSGQISKASEAGVKIYPTLKLGKEKYTLVSEPGIIPDYGLVKVEDLEDESELLAVLVKRGASCLKKADSKKA